MIHVHLKSMYLFIDTEDFKVLEQQRHVVQTGLG